MQRDNTEWWAYPCKCLTFGCLATTGMSNLRLPNNDGIRPNTSQYIYESKYRALKWREEQYYRIFVCEFISPERNLQTSNVLIYYGMITGNTWTGAMPHRQTCMHVRDARLSVLCILAHTAYIYLFIYLFIYTPYCCEWKQHRGLNEVLKENKH
jgi:hypothetical protein